MLPIVKEIKSHRNLERAKILSKFFKSGKGDYGEGDVFWGLPVPISRKIAKKYKDLNKKEIYMLLRHKVHEVRLIALLILVQQYRTQNSVKNKKAIVNFYLKNTKYVNNWDLVDLSACHILGNYLLGKKNNEKKILLELSDSKNLWEQRISIVSTFAFIKNGELNWTIRIVKKLLDHKHDLIHKACGWMLREVGKKNDIVLKKFLDRYVHIMPRTMLRYAIEKFPEKIRLSYLKK